MFFLLKVIIFSNFDTKGEANIKCMFKGCPEELRKKIKNLYKKNYNQNHLDYLLFS